MRYHDNTLPPLTSLASPCGYATTSDDLKLEELAAKTNCFCVGEGWTQFAADCELSAECVYLYEAQTGYLGAQEGCRLAHSDARLASIHNQEKSDFLAAIARNYSVTHNHEITKVWTGLRFQAREGYTWDDETSLDWWRSEHGGRSWSDDVCASMTIGGGNWWTPETCAIDRPSLSYFCQRPACDASNFCSAVNSK